MFTDLPARSASNPPWWRRMDWILMGAVSSLSLLGTLLVWAATRPSMIANDLDPNSYLKKQLVVLALSVLLMVLVARSRYLMLRAFAPLLYAAGVLGLIAVLVLGSEVNGIRAWIQLPFGYTLQPSEFAKLAIVIGVAMVLSETAQRHGTPGTRLVLAALGLVAVPVGLIMLQPDLGTTLVIGVMTLGLLAVSGAGARWTIGLSAVAVVGAITIWSIPNLLADYQKDRLRVFLDPSIDPQNAGYNLRQVRLAIGSGGWTGAGLFNGPQTNGRFVPEQQTDFIYSAAGEELGFIGAGLIILLLLVVAWRAIEIARQADRFGQIAAVGVACWIAFQSFENIGMNLGIMPMTGVPLPFVSYGGSSMFALWMAVGLLQNIRMKRTD